MKLKSLSVAAALTAALATTLAATTPATAVGDNYPPQGDLQVSASPSGVAKYYVINVANVGGGCKVKISAAGRTSYARADAQGVVPPITVRFSTTGSFTVKASTTLCAWRSSASTVVDVTTFDLDYKTRVRNNSSAYVRIKGWRARTPVTIRLWTPMDGQVVATRTYYGTTNSRGDLNKSIKLSPRGIWALQITQGGTTIGGSIQVY